MKIQMTPKFTASRYEGHLIKQIVERIVKMAKQDKVRYSRLDASMDIEACHCNGCPLNLHELLAADDGTFGHDVYGIRRHIDRQTGKLKDCFLPRTALPDSKPEKR